MSLAFYASPIDESYPKIKNNESSSSIVNQSQKLKKNRRKKENMSNKVSKALENIHNNLKDGDDEDELHDFNPPPFAESSGLERMDEREINKDENYVENFENDDTYLEENEESQHDYVDPYYKSGLAHLPVPAYNMYTSPKDTSPNLDKKLSYIIELLENQKNEKTDHVMEEFALYTFLGIFVIFISDSFVRVGKYVR